MTNTTILPRPTAPRVARFARTAALARAAAPLLLAALAACGDDNDPVGASAPNTVRFTYAASGPTEGVEGDYNAVGDPDRAVPPLTQTYALGRRDPGEGLLEVVSNVAYPQQEADFVTITIPRLTEGSVAIDGTCPGELCPGVSLGLELSTAVAVSQARYSCALETGTIRVASIRDNRMKGTFSGTGSCIGAPGYEDLDEFSITGGTFNVKVVDVPG